MDTTDDTGNDNTDSSDSTAGNDTIDLGDIHDSSGVKNDFQVSVSGEPVTNTPPDDDK